MAESNPPSVREEQLYQASKRQQIEAELGKCDPEYLDITVFNDRQCTKPNHELTKKAQLTDKQKQKFTACQMLTHGQKIYGKVVCRDNGFIVNVFTDKDCTSHATKSGRPLKTPIYYGRCHKEGQGVYFVVNKMVPKLNIEEDKVIKNITFRYLS